MKQNIRRIVKGKAYSNIIPTREANKLNNKLNHHVAQEKIDYLNDVSQNREILYNDEYIRLNTFDIRKSNMNGLPLLFEHGMEPFFNNPVGYILGHEVNRNGELIIEASINNKNCSDFLDEQHKNGLSIYLKKC